MLFWHLGVTAAIVYATLGRRRIDYRVVLLGALLPDLIDEPLGRFFFRERYDSQHLWGHTLLLVVVLSLGVMLFLRGEAARRWFVLPMAALVHLGLDAMWSHPVNFYWPLFGAHFPREHLGLWWHALGRPVEILEELVGLGLLVYLGIGHDLQDPDHRRQFLKTGKLEGANPAR
jgi:inner membrane protein